MISPRSVAFIVCRILALYLLSTNLLGLVLLVRDFAVSQYFGSVIGPLDYAQSGALVVLPAIPVLWFGAGWFSSKIAKETKSGQEKEPWTRERLLSLGVMFAGLLIVMWAIPSLFAAADYYPREEAEDLFAEQLIYAVPQIVLGVLCLLGSRTIARFLAFARQWDSERGS